MVSSAKMPKMAYSVTFFPTPPILPENQFGPKLLSTVELDELCGRN